MDAPGSEPEYRQLAVPRGADRLGVQVYADPRTYAVDARHPTSTGRDRTSPLILLWPAMGVPAGYYRPLARRLRESGLRVAVADLRGTGASRPPASRRSRYGYAELVEDVGAVLDHLVGGPASGATGHPGTPTRPPDPVDAERADPAGPTGAADPPVVLLGHSLGGQASLLHVALSGDRRVAGLALVATGLPYWRCYRGPLRFGVLPFTQAIGAASALLGFWPGWGFGGRQANGVIRDWAYTGRTGRFPPIGGVDVDRALGSMRTPMLAVSLERDRFTPAETIDYLCGLVPRSPVERVHLTGAQLGTRPDHFRWARTPGPIPDRIAAFAAATTDGRAS